MIDFGTVRPGTTLYIPFATYDSNDPTASVTMTGLAVTDIEIYKDGGTTQRASDAGYTLLDTDGIDFDALTGIHGFSVNLADNTTAGFYASGSQYWVVVSSITVDSGTISFIAATFRIGYPDAILNTTIATLASQTSFTLTVGPADDNALVGCVVLIHDVASAVQMEMGVCSAYTGSTKTVTLAADPGVFTAAASDNIAFYFPINTRWITQTAQTARDLGASVLLSSGTGTGQVNLSSGTVSLTATTGLGNQTANITGNLSGSVGSVTGAVGSVTGAVGSVTGAVGSVTGAVGSVTGSVGSVAANGITATSIATDAINAAAVKADAVTKIQTGLATPTNITAGTITTVTNLTNAPTAGDLTATMKTSVTTAATAATPTAAAVTGAVGSVTGNVGGNVAGSVGSVTGDTKQTADVATLITTVGVAGAGLTALATQASVNTIDDFLDTEIAAILADTNELQTDWANGGRLDLILDAASAPTAAAVADAVWDEALSGHTGSGTAGLALATASSGGVDPSVLADAIWDEALSGHATAGTTGKKLTDLANADLSGVATATNLETLAGYVDTEVAAILAAVDTEVAAIKTKTDYLPSATAGAAGGVFIAGSNAATSITTALTANITGNLSGSVGSVTGAVGSVTGAVGSVTGAVGSVTGNVGGSVATVAANGITATSIATDAINAASVKADAVTKIQAGLATPTNITAGTITTVTNLTNAPTAGDLTATMKTSVTTAATAATPTAAAVTGAVGSVTGNVGGNVVGSVASVTAGVTLANDAITAAKFDESTAFPLTSVDTGATRVARTGADADTLETLSDQLDAAVLDGVLFLGDTQIA